MELSWLPQGLIQWVCINPAGEELIDLASGQCSLCVHPGSYGAGVQMRVFVGGWAASPNESAALIVLPGLG